ncbi:MAG: VCBS repeat-containing protein [Myxococcota bacterium]
MPLSSIRALVVLGVVSLACSGDVDSPPSASSEANPLTAEEVVESEETIEGLRAPLATLSKGVLNLELPDERARGILEATVSVVDLAQAPSAGREQLLGLGFERLSWPPRDAQESHTSGELVLWEGFLKTVAFFHHFNFYNVRGSFQGDVYTTETGFKGLAQLQSGLLAAVEGKLELDWKKHSGMLGMGESSWRVARLETKEFRILEGSEPLFTDVSDLAFGRPDWLRAAHSPRDEHSIETVLAIRSGAKEMETHIASIHRDMEAGTYDAINPTQAAVVDIDRDGYDDFYFTASDSPSLFFRNRGDGSFEEISQELGLDFVGVYSAAFADFDNDGDSDAFISFFNRADATRYLRNEDGRFEDRSDTIEGGLPSWVVPIGVTDYNNDGLLDVYLGTYVNAYLPSLVARDERIRGETGESPGGIPWIDEEVSREVFRRLRADGHPVSNAPGPPNWLLQNVGEGRFRRAKAAGTAEGYNNTLAVGWTDLDLDGDMDLYVVNESGPNQLLRNEGDGTFRDISNAHTGEIGFGMGLGVGDYDNDGRSDFYTTNMFSKAGMRIADQMQSSEIVQQSARGNSLIRNGGNEFTRVSSQDSSGIQVEAADFGWGGSFVDLNNDGFLDIYVPAGQESMPVEVATIGDS